MVIFLFFLSYAQAMCSNCQVDVYMSQTQVAADKTAVYIRSSFTATPTLTPTLTLTPIPAHVNQGSTRRMVVFGNSWACGWTCSGGCSEGFLPALIAAYPDLYTVGNTAVSNAVPILTPQAYTSAVGGLNSVEITQVILSSLSSKMPSPVNTDVIFLGPMLANDTNYPAMNNLVSMTAHMLAAITITSSINPLARIAVVEDLSFHDRDNSVMHQAWSDAYDAAAGMGYTRIFRVPANSCIDYNTDYCVGDPHVSLLGNNKLGGCIAAQIPEP